MTDQHQEPHPYIGPRPFERTAVDQNRFFGRDAETDEIVSLIYGHPLVLVYAQSGAGKTSLINAGLIPQLEKEGFETLPVARVQGLIPERILLEEAPNPYLYNTLVSLAPDEDDPTRLARLSLGDFLRQRGRVAHPGRIAMPRVVIFDQFEELFTLDPERWDAKRSFLIQVADALKDDQLLRFVFVIREEYIAQLEPHAPLLPEKLLVRFRLERLRQQAALDAVEGPLRDKERQFAPGVARALVEELLKIRSRDSRGQTVEEPGQFVEPVQLQVVCQRIWQNLPDEVTEIGEEHLREFGDVDEALAAFYERAIQSAALKTVTAESDLREWCERDLITRLGTRDTVLQEDATQSIRIEALNELETLHLIRREQRAGARWYELTHDRFIRPILQSNQRWRQIAETVRQEARPQRAGVVIGLFSPELASIYTSFRSKGIQLVAEQRRVSPEAREQFAADLGATINHCLHPSRYSDPGIFRDASEIGDSVLRQFATRPIAEGLQNNETGYTVLLELDSVLQHIPWESILETPPLRRIPFAVGRYITDLRTSRKANPPTRGGVRIKVLLIGDPTDDLPEAGKLVRDLGGRLQQDKRFEVKTCIGSRECRRARLLDLLATGQYGLVHYSGPIRSHGEGEAWQLTNDESIAADTLVSALQTAPPAMVSCVSYESPPAPDLNPQTILYREQSADLPRACLQAGVEAYVGTLWPVDALAARRFMGRFYEAFLSGEPNRNLGQCLYEAKRPAEQGRERINQLAYVLYGDPGIEPGQLFPALYRDVSVSENTRTVLKTQFHFGTTTVEILQGDILYPGVEVDAIVSTDDNYLTMSSGVSALLRAQADSEEYVLEAQTQCPVKAGTVVVTKAYGLASIPNIQRVLHATVIDYDSEDRSLEELVREATTNCLLEAERLAVRRILFPPFATGAGRLSMEATARPMCTAIKAYLARERPIQAIYLMLYLPLVDIDASPRKLEQAAANQRFVREANLVLGSPYDPASDRRQVRDFYGRDAELGRLEAIISGREDSTEHKGQAVIVGGTGIGKLALLDQLFYRAQQPASPLGQGRRLVNLTFGYVHEDTPQSFIYRKLLLALSEGEVDASLRSAIRSVYARPDLDCEQFLAFLQEHAHHYPEVVFLVDDLPRLLQMESRGTEDSSSVRAFWADLERLETRVRFVFTAAYGEPYQEFLKRLNQFTFHFRDNLTIFILKCITAQERRAWIDALYQRYLGRDATTYEHGFIEREAGRHPYLISLAGHALITALLPDTLDNRMGRYDSSRILEPFFQTSRTAIEGPRQGFFNLLVGPSLGPEDRANLQSLARAVAIEEQKIQLLSDLSSQGPVVLSRLQDLQREGNPRISLDRETLVQLEARGYLVDADDPSTAQFMAKSFADWVIEYFGVGQSRDTSTR